ncbi:MAG: hypothetical protein LC136_08010 [Burkholderiales bacterium]|nr:hypothetical protein [Bacteroidia bacterium]MCZ2414181.1 hypothetical protein [Burkholderiales bacterium]
MKTKIKEQPKSQTAKSSRLENVVRRFVEKYDWFIYRRAFNTLKRMCNRNAGFAYLMELHIKKYRELHHITPELERATEAFFETLEENA